MDRHLAVVPADAPAPAPVKQTPTSERFRAAIAKSENPERTMDLVWHMKLRDAIPLRNQIRDHIGEYGPSREAESALATLDAVVERRVDWLGEKRDALATSIAALEDRLTAAYRAQEAVDRWLRELVEEDEKQKLEGDVYTFGMQRNGGLAPLEIYDETAVPDCYKLVEYSIKLKADAMDEDRITAIRAFILKYVAGVELDESEAFDWNSHVTEMWGRHIGAVAKTETVAIDNSLVREIVAKTPIEGIRLGERSKRLVIKPDIRKQIEKARKAQADDTKELLAAIIVDEEGEQE